MQDSPVGSSICSTGPSSVKFSRSIHVHCFCTSLVHFLALFVPSIWNNSHYVLLLPIASEKSFIFQNLHFDPFSFYFFNFDPSKCWECSSWSPNFSKSRIWSQKLWIHLNCIFKTSNQVQTSRHLFNFNIFVPLMLLYSQFTSMLRFSL